WRARDVVRGGAFEIHREVLVGDVEQPGAGRERAGLPVLRAGRSRGDVTDDLARLRLLFLVWNQAAALQVDALARRDPHKWRGGENFAGAAIEHVDVAVAIGVDQHL